MSELNLNISVAPELQTAVTGGAEIRTRPGAGTPAIPASPDNPFAALLSGFLQGTQPQTPAAGPVQPEPGLASNADEQPESSAGISPLLALPANAAALPAIPGTSADSSTATGNSLPVTGKLLPELPATPPAADTPATTGAGPRISLADLALSRPLEAPSAGSGDTPVPPLPAQTPTPVPTEVQALAQRSFQQKDGRSSPATDMNPPRPLLTGTEGPGRPVTPVAVPISADELAVRLGTRDLHRDLVLPDAGSDSLAGQLAAFAAGNDSSAAPVSATASGAAGGTDATNTTLLSRLSNTTLPPLQPLAGNTSFATGLADRLLTLGGPGTHTARLRLHPEHLGELNVEIQIDEGSAQVWFGTASSQARDAIEASLPHLKALFADQGLALTRTQVDNGSGQMGQQSFDQQRRSTSGTAYEADRTRRHYAQTGSSPLAALLPPARPSNRLVDAWA